MLDGGNAVVIDVRRPDEWAEGHVQGATHIPVDDVLARIDELPQGMDLALHLRPGRPQRLGVRDGRRHELRDGASCSTSRRAPRPG